MSAVLVVRNLSFEFSNGRQLFKDLNFSIDAKITALVGPNGVGKTCLARLLANELQPTEGKISRNGSVRFLPQRVEPKAISVNDLLASTYSWSALGEALLEGIDRDAWCTQLSGGQWMRVRLAQALDEQFLILDEPTNDLDRTGRDAVTQFLRDHSGGVLLISHDRECLELCDDVLELSNQGLSKFGAGWDEYVEAKEHEREGLSRALDVAKRERDAAAADRIELRERQEKRNRKGQQAAKKGGMPKILLGKRKRSAEVSSGKIDSSTMERSNQAVSDAHEALSKLKIDPVMYADLVGVEIPAQKLVAEARGFNIRFSKWLYPEDLNFAWRGNIRIALKGSNGSGKSTLLKAILGAEYETRGELRRGNLAALYIDQRCASLDDAKSIFDNVRDVTDMSESDIRNGLAKFLFAKESVFQKVSELSGGERLRAALAKGFLSNQRPELLVLDEPTNNLDLVNVEFLEALVSSYRGALLVISHDEIFLDHCKVQEQFHL